LRTKGTLISLHPDGKKLRISDSYTHYHKNYFGTVREIDYTSLQDVLRGLVGKKGRNECKDFVSLMVLYIFTMLLFPRSGGKVTTSMIPYAKNLKALPGFAWAKVVHESMMLQLVSAREKSTINIGGCVLAIVVRFL
jgi:hypothetical protein